MSGAYTPASYTRRTFYPKNRRVYADVVYAPDILSEERARIRRRRIRAGHPIRLTSAYTTPAYTRRTSDAENQRIYDVCVYALVIQIWI